MGAQELGFGSRLTVAVGLCLTPHSIGRALGLSADDVAALIDGYRLLALTTADGHVVFPAFQLDDGDIVSGLPPVLRALREGIDDPWTWALWLSSTPPVVEGVPAQVSRIQQLIDGEFDIVLRAAQRSAASWRS